MGKLTSYRFIRHNRSIVTRFFVSLAFLVAIVVSTVLAYSSPVSAATTFNWTDEATITATLDSGERVTYTDSNPFDTNRTFTDTRPSYCTNNAINTIVAARPGAGTHYYITTPRPSSGAKVNCEIKTESITIGSIQNASRESRSCSGSQESCAFRNAQWAQKCNFIGPPAPGDNLCNSQTSPPPFQPTASTSNSNQNDPEFDPCDSLGGFSMRWIMCPVLTGATGIVDALDSLVEDQLHYDTAIFDRNNDGGKGFYAAWNVFRNISLALVLIVGLVMVVSQGTGMQIFDAYTVRKVMPRLLIAVVGITLSWPILQFVITLFNDLGHLVQDIILMPFQDVVKSTDPEGLNKIKDYTGAVVLGTAILGVATGVAAYAIIAGPGILALAGTVALALFVGWLVIAIRALIITTAVLFAPIAIACYILPNTKKVWDFWKNALFTALVIFPIIMFLLATGKALSFIAPQGILKVISFAAPYFMLPFAFRLAGGLISTVASLAGDRSRGLFKTLSDARENQAKKRFERWTEEGRLFKPESKLNRLGLAIGAYKRAEDKSALNPLTRKGRSALAAAALTQRRLAAMRRAATDAAKVTRFDDPQLQAQMAGATEKEARENLRTMYKDWDEAKIESAIAAARANGGFSRAQQIYAFEAAAATGTAITSHKDALRIAANIAKGDETLETQLAARLKQGMVAAGRTSYGASIGSWIKAIHDYYERGEQSKFADGTQLMAEAVMVQDPTSFLRGKSKDVEEGFAAFTKVMEDNNKLALNGDTEAMQKLVEMTVTLNAYEQATPYASMDATRALRESTLKVRGIRENVLRATQASVPVRQPIIDDETGQQVHDTAGNPLYRTVTRVETITGPDGQTREVVVPVVQPNLTKTNKETGEFGYNDDIRNLHRPAALHEDYARMRRGIYDPMQDPSTRPSSPKPREESEQP